MNLDQARKPPYKHQIVGVQKLISLVEPEIGRTYPGCLLLADEMRLGKTKQVIDAANVLFKQGEINKVVVVCPAPVRDVWFDPEIGELAKHQWDSVPATIYEYHSKTKFWRWKKDQNPLIWIITNYEFIGHGVEGRSGNWHGDKLDPLMAQCDNKTMLVLDESSWVKSHKAQRTRACMMLRSKCSRVVELNGTPISQSPKDLYSQARILDWRILGCKTNKDFVARYAITEPMVLKDGRRFSNIVGWRNIAELQQRMAPYVLRRIRTECLDLPPKLSPVALTATLTPETWRMYRDLREELIIQLSEDRTVSAAQAGVRVMRLAQLTSGFLGGVEEEVSCPDCQGSNINCLKCGGAGVTYVRLPEPQEVGREKLNLLISWVEQRLEEEPDFRMIIWCRFRPEIFRTIRELRHHFKQINVQAIHGGQGKDDRHRALKLMHPDHQDYAGPAVLIGTIGTGSVGLNMAGGHEVIYLSNGNSLFQRKQSEDRPHGPGQTQPVAYHDIIAEGPKGQRTVDHLIVANLHKREEVADWTVSAWVSALKQEAEEG